MTTDDGSLTAPHPNGSAGDRAPARRRHAPWEFVILALFVAILGIGIILAWTLVGSRSPERLDNAAAATLSRHCDDTQARLRHLPNPFPREGAHRVARIRAENEILRDMVAGFGSVAVVDPTPARAARAWAEDWTNVIEARERYARELEATRGTDEKVQFVLPKEKGLKAVTARMNDFVRQNHPNLDACFTDALELETVEGPREYEDVSR
jgi:hypothetical protein